MLDDVEPMTEAEKKDLRALKAALARWRGFGWHTESIALGWFMRAGYEHARSRELSEMATAERPPRQPPPPTEPTPGPRRSSGG